MSTCQGCATSHTPKNARHRQPGQRQGDRRHAGDDGALAGVAARGVARGGHCVVTPRVRRALGGSVRVELERGGSVLQDGSNGCFCKREKFEEEVHRTHFSRGTSVEPTNLDRRFQASANPERAVNQGFFSFERFSKVPNNERLGVTKTERNENAPSGMLGAFKQMVRPEGFEPPTF